MNPRGRGRLRRVAVVAHEEFRRALEGRWLFGFTALLTALVLGLSFFGLAQGREVGFQGFARVTLSLMNLVLFTVPLTGLVLGVTSMTGGASALPLLLAQPIGRGEVLIGKHAGVALALTAAQAIELAKRDGSHRFMHAFPNVENGASNAICRKLGFELLEACEFEFPKGHFMTCNDWRLDLRA